MRRIVVLQRGWVVVGIWEQSGPYVTLREPAVVRRWGTSKGLGQLASEGPQSQTVLDPSPEIRFHELTAVLWMDCVEEAWAPKGSRRKTEARS